MPRALISARATVPDSQREVYLTTASVQQKRVAAAGGNYWLFENAEQSGQFVMFLEASDRAALDRVVAAQGGSGLEHAPVFVEVKLN